MPLADFHRSDPFTLGIELELQVVNPPGYDLSQDASTLIADVQHELTVGEAKHDITESMLEIATGVCRDISHAQIQLSAIQQAVQRAALRHHLQICGGGSHPFHAWQRQQISDNPRYVKTVEHFGYLAQQATVFGQHVHVGCQSGDDAIYLLHGLSRFVPHFIALNAASPWFDSTDSRFACSRLNRFSSYPDNGPMPWVADWQGFRRLFRQLSYTSMIDSMKDLHWDIRPSPQFGTVEVRVMDTPLTLAQAIHIAGFIQTLACWLLTERPFKHQPDRRVPGLMPSHTVTWVASGGVSPASTNRCRVSSGLHCRAFATPTSTASDGFTSRPCSSQVYQVTPTSASIATSSRRRPGVRRRPTRGNPRRCGSRLSRRARRKAPSCLRRSSGTAIVDSRCGIVVITPPA